MADTTGSGKRGFRGIFGMRSNGNGKNDPASRKKLSKKTTGAGLESPKNIDGIVGANAMRQDSGSFIAEENAWRRRDTAPTLIVRDDAQLGLDMFKGNVPSGNVIDQHNVENRVQYPRYQGDQHQAFNLPFHTMSNPRSASEPFVQTAYMESKSLPSLPAKPAPTKLQKANRGQPLVEEILDKDTGERKDLTDMMHAFTYNVNMESEDEKSANSSMTFDASRPDGTAILGRASPEIWLLIADLLSPLDVANLSSTCRTLSTRLGRYPYKLLLRPENSLHRMDFLLDLDRKLPRHLFCFPCLQWHLRIQPGLESLKPHNVLNPLFECPNRTSMHIPPPRIRITDGRMLPFTFVQLARRSRAFGAEFGIQHQSLARRWKEPYSKWQHETSYHITDKNPCSHESQITTLCSRRNARCSETNASCSAEKTTHHILACAPIGKKDFLHQYPSVRLIISPTLPCQTHLLISTLRDKAVGRKAHGVVNLCNVCRPMRRCPKCPTEYLFELKMLEDKSEHSFSPDRFKQALLVTRWSDLGPARSPGDAEWAAVVGENQEYNSFKEIGMRAVSGVFESAFTDSIPGQRILSMNPKGLTVDEIGGNWY